jgi:hypothetical protein
MIGGWHFFALRLVFDVGFLFTGGSMFALSLGTGYALARRLLSSRPAMAVTGFGCAIILWLAALMIFALGHTMKTPNQSMKGHAAQGTLP